MNPVLLIAGVIITVIALLAISLPFIKHNATKSAYDLWDEPPAPESDTKAGN